MQYKQVVIAGETWSSNLGDGVIAESMQFLIQKLKPELHVSYLDISGRRISTPHSSESRSFVSQFSQKIKPLNFLRIISKHQLVKSQRKSDWHSQISNSDLVIIGGGQLLMDNNLDFPLKISTISKIAYSLGKNVHFVACGVGKKWSYAGVAFI
jgi:polysaccharide pyruvyl transferase WcaK-like protein